MVLFLAHPEHKLVMSMNLLESSNLGYSGLDEIGRDMISQLKVQNGLLGLMVKKK